MSEAPNGRVARRQLMRMLSGAPLWLSACAVPGSQTATRYGDSPEMMAVGDSLYQGVRSLTFTRGMGAISPPALVAGSLGLSRFTVPEPPRAVMFDLEEIYRRPFPLIAIAVDVPRTLIANSLAWRADPVWSSHEAFDNVAIGGALIDSLWKDTYATHWASFQSKARDLPFDLARVEVISDLWYSLNTAFVLNPRRRDEQAHKTQLDQVADRRPPILLVNIGSNEGLFSAAFSGQVASGSASLTASRSKMDELSRRLAALPRQVETIVFNSLIRPRAATNLMPIDRPTPIFPGPAYFDAYGPWLFSDQQPISGDDLRRFDQLVADQNTEVHDMLKQRLGSRLVYADLYAMSDRYDGKHYRDRVLPVRDHRLQNVPLNGTNAGFGGGLTGLDNMHPTGPGYAIIADTVLTAMGAGKQVAKERAFDRDTLLNDLPPLLNTRHAEVLALVGLIRGLGNQGLAAPPT